MASDNIRLKKWYWWYWIIALIMLTMMTARSISTDVNQKLSSMTHVILNFVAGLVLYVLPGFFLLGLVLTMVHYKKILRPNQQLLVWLVGLMIFSSPLIFFIFQPLE